MIILFVTSLFLFAFLVEAIELYLFISAVLYVYEHPKLPLPMNLFAVALSASAIIFCAISWLLQLPLPYTDYSNLSRLKELEETNPPRAAQVRQTIAQHGLRRERRNNLVLQQVVMVGVMVGFYLFRYREEFFSDIFLLSPVIVGSVVLSFFISPILDRIEAAVILRSNHSDDKELQVEKYVNNKKRLFRLRLFVSLVSGVFFFLPDYHSS